MPASPVHKVLVVLSSFIAHVFIYGICWSVGVWNGVLLKEFHRSVAETSVVGALLNATLYLAGFSGSFLLQYMSCRSLALIGSILTVLGLLLSSLVQSLFLLYGTFSLCVGFGLGLSYMPAVEIVSLHFPAGATVAMGFASCGNGLGMLLMPLANKWLIANYDWRTAFQCTALVCGFLVFVTTFMTPPKADSQKDASSSSADADEILEKKIEESQGSEYPLITTPQPAATSPRRPISYFLRNPSIYLISFNNFLFMVGTNIVLVHIVRYLSQEVAGLKREAPLAISVIGIANMMGRILMGAVCHLKFIDSCALYTLSCGISGLACLTFIYLPTEYDNIKYMIVCIIIFGFFTGAIGPLLPQILTELFSREYMSTTYGIVLIFECIGSIMGPPVAGYFIDISKGYTECFLLAGVSLMLAMVVMFPVLRKLVYTSEWAKDAPQAPPEQKA